MPANIYLLSQSTIETLEKGVIDVNDSQSCRSGASIVNFEYIHTFF